jgi:hypothetical protein
VRTPRSLMLCTLLVSLALTALAQLTVDATGPIRQRKRDAARGHVGCCGRKLPLQVAMETTGSPPDENGQTLVEFVLTNSGKKALVLPVSPHPGDLEPSDPNATYSGMSLGLRIGLSKKPAGIFGGGADLFGSKEFPGTLVSLAPGDSIRVLARVALPQVGNTEPEAFKASALLGTETIKRVNGELVSESQNVGFADSPEYTLESLFRPHD